MKWIRERDALIAQTMAFVQSVTGKKDGFHPPELPPNAFAVTTEIVTIRETVTVEDAAVQSVPEPQPKDQLQPVQLESVQVESVQVEPVQVEPAHVEALQIQPVEPLPVQVPLAMASPSRLSIDVRSEMQTRIANFRKHQERFEREREEYCAATLTRLRAAIRDPSLRPPADK